MDKAAATPNNDIQYAFGTGLSTRRQGAAWTTRQALFQTLGRTAFHTDGGQLAYHPGRHSGTPPSVSVIAGNTVRDQWNAHPANCGQHCMGLRAHRGRPGLLSALPVGVAKARAIWLPTSRLARNALRGGKGGIQSP